nr:reverse transcriptase domain-containing protein [Tanacetum cinerariifolium]
MSREEEAKLMQTFHKTCFYNDYRDRDSNHDNWRSNERSSYNRDNYRSNTDDKPYDLQKQFNDFIQSHQSTNAFIKETFMDLKTQLETVAKNHQASIQNLEIKFEKLADKQSGRPSGSLPSNTQPNPKGHNSKAYQPPPIHCVPKKGGITVVTNEKDELVPTRTVMGWRVCIDYRKLNKAIAKDHFPLPFMDQILERLVGNKYSVSSMVFLGLEVDEAKIDVISKLPPPTNIKDEGSKILHSIEGTLLEEEIFAEFDEFMAMTADINSDFESDTEDLPFKKITINTDYKIKISLEKPPTDLKLKPVPDNLEYVFMEEPSFLPVIISSQLFKEKKDKLISVL